ncbi:MAG: DUF4266 domain-containing protein [Nitrospinae bacterium]|nr:DUF4266 domain-containing protein [Nitrospinota bacterium]
MNFFLSLLLVLSLHSCSFTNVKPWERGLFAKPTMSLGGHSKAIKRYNEHIYFSKEGSKGGSGVSGGGCGCN